MCFLLDIILIFDSIAAVTPIKYHCGTLDLTITSCKAEISMNKWMNEDIGTSTLCTNNHAFAERNIFAPIVKTPSASFNKKMSSYQYMKSHCGDKTILRPSYLHHGISHTGKIYWIGAQMSLTLVNLLRHTSVWSCAAFECRQSDSFQKRCYVISTKASPVRL